MRYFHIFDVLKLNMPLVCDCYRLPSTKMHLLITRHDFAKHICSIVLFNLLNNNNYGYTTKK